MLEWNNFLSKLYRITFIYRNDSNKNSCLSVITGLHDEKFTSNLILECSLNVDFTISLKRDKF